MMLVPNVREPSPEIQERLRKAFDLMRGRNCQPLLKELDQAARIELDDATFELLGIANGVERAEFKNDLYDQMTSMYQEIREVELKKQVERRTTVRRDNASPHSVAEEIWEEFDKSAIRVFPAEFLTDR